MFVTDWMTKKVITVGPDDSISDALALMKENCIKHLPVLKGGKLKGIISDRDIKEFSPSKATSLDVYEIHYLLARAKVRDSMKTRVITTSPDTPVEEAALVLMDRAVGCLPVMEDDKLVGIISDRDIYHALVDITGVRHGGHRVCLTIEDRPGSIREVADIIRDHGFRLQGILTSYEGVREGYRKVVIRTKGKGDFSRLKADLEERYRTCRIRRG
ncbi:MAG TPA: CBS and ACT domain-containing protein [Nitrospirota bacterium]|nr:CBS and ACT domain-containing protein [Nitrospirota bacterium]